MKYNEAFNKITEAYIKGEIQPYKCEFCFCGTLAPNANWFMKELNDNTLVKYPYTIQEYLNMEWALLHTIDKEWWTEDYCKMDMVADHPNYEEFLFKGMCTALDVLKQIHIERGEIINEEPILKKRELVTI